MCRATTRAGWRNITACSAPSCASSTRSMASPPAIGRPKTISEGEIASWSIDTKASDWQTRTTYDFLRVEDFIQRDMALPIWRIVAYHDLDLSAADRARHRVPLHGGELAVPDLHHLAAYRVLVRGRLPRADRIVRAPRPGCARHPLAVRLARDDCAVLRRAVGAAENHREIHLSALSDVRHDLDLGVLARRAPRMGRAARPLRAASLRGRAQQRRRRRSCWSATAPARSSAPKFSRARSNAIPHSASTARASCC